MNEKNKNHLNELVQRFEMTDHQRRHFAVYIDLLEQWSARINLVSQGDRNKLVTKHVDESLQLLKDTVFHQPCSVLDLGSGAGFPGLCLSIVMPLSHFTLVDSKRSKFLFLSEVIEKTGLENVRVICERVEHLDENNHGNQYDYITARAVASLDTLWKWSAFLLAPKGALIAIKGGDVETEMAKLKGLFNISTVNLSLPHGKSIVVVSRGEPHDDRLLDKKQYKR